MKICIVIPAHNESKTIGGLVRALREMSLNVLIVDDGSTDGCGEIAIQEGAYVIHHPQRKGKGASLREGFNYICQSGHEGIIIMDADGQHDPSDIPYFLQGATDHEVDLIIGNRMENAKNMPPVRYMTNRFMSWMISRACKRQIPDTQCGFRYISVRALKTISFECDGFEIETEMLIKAARNNLRIISIPIKTIYRDETSKIHPFKDAVRFFRYFFKETWMKKP